jgi:cation diffusion facilitator family transporter
MATQEDLNDHRAKQRAAAFSIASNATLIVFKLVVGLLSGSVAIMSEALHSGSDLVAAVIAFFAVRKSAQPANASYHYGHEKVENVSGVAEALLIIMAAGVIIYEGVRMIINGPEIDHVWLGIGVMLVSGVANLIISRKVLYPVARRTESAALEADAAHLLTDVYTSFGVAGGLLLVELTGWQILDPIVAIAVALLIIKTGYDLTVDSVRVLLDRTLPEEELAGISACLDAHRGGLIVDYHSLRARRGGSRRHVDFHITVDGAMTVAEGHAVAGRIAAELRALLPKADILVHVDPEGVRAVGGEWPAPSAVLPQPVG